MIAKNSTKEAYNSAIKSFIAFGGHCPAKPRLILKYISEMGALGRVDRLKASSLKAHVSAIRRWHLEAEFADPTSKVSIKDALTELESLERQSGIYADASRFITPEECLKVITLLLVMDDTPKARRNRLIVAVSLMAGHRTSMIAQIKVEQLMNLGVAASNIIINTPSFKTKAQEPTCIPYTGGEFCPATWIREYIAEANLHDGFLFRATQVNTGKPLSRQTVNNIVKEILSEAGIVGGKLTSTSFRKTMATIASMEGVGAMEIAAQGSWSSVETINKHYVGKALALLGRAPNAVLESIARVSSELDQSPKSILGPEGTVDCFRVLKNGQSIDWTIKESKRLHKELTEFLVGK